jgi:hypothetical protein
MDISMIRCVTICVVESSKLTLYSFLMSSETRPGPSSAK